MRYTVTCLSSKTIFQPGNQLKVIYCLNFLKNLELHRCVFAKERYFTPILHNGTDVVKPG